MPFFNKNTTFNFIDNLSKVIGAHTIKMGFYAQRSWKDQTSFGRINGDINFANDGANPPTSGYTFANALLGVMTVTAVERLPQRPVPLLEPRGLHPGQLEGKPQADAPIMDCAWRGISRNSINCCRPRPSILHF